MDCVRDNPATAILVYQEDTAAVMGFTLLSRSYHYHDRYATFPIDAFFYAFI